MSVWLATSSGASALPDDVQWGRLRDLQGCGNCPDLPEESSPVTLHPMLLELLVCPDCKGTVTLDSTSSELVCDECGLVYPIRDGIPIMLVSEARRPDAAAPRDDSDGDAADESVAEPTDD